MVEQPLQDSGLLSHQYFCSSVFLMNCTEHCKTFYRVLNVLKLLSNKSL